MDVADYIMRKDAFDVYAAAALYLFYLDFVNRLREKENNKGVIYNSIEIDEFVDELYSAKYIDQFKERAKNIVKDYQREARQMVYLDKIDESLGNNHGQLRKIFFNRGAWQGFFGNMITLVMGIVFSIIVAGYEANNIGKSTYEFANRCLSPIIHPGKLNNTTN